MKVAVLANWGIGRETVAALIANPVVNLALVITLWEDGTRDAWRNCVRDYCREAKVPVQHGGAWQMPRLAAYLAGQTDLLVVHAWPKLLPRPVFSAPPLGSVNIHPSLLPRYRGPAPEVHVLKNRDPLTGLTSHVIDEGMDTGPVVARLSVALDKDETREGVIEKQKKLVRPLLDLTIERLSDPGFKPEAQDHRLASFAPKTGKRLPPASAAG